MKLCRYSARLGRRSICVTGLLLALSAAGVCGAAETTLPASVDASHALSEGLELHAQWLEMRDQLSQAQSTSRVDFYLGAVYPELLLRDVTLIIDELPPLHYQFSEVEAAALQQSALQRLQLPALAAGSHRLRARFIARDPGSTSRAPAVDARLDQSFSVSGPVTSVELQLDKPGRLSSAAPVLRSLNDPASVADARVRYAALLIAGGRGFAASSELRALQLQSSQAALPASWAQQMAKAHSAAGLQESTDASDLDAAADAALIGRYQRAIAAADSGGGAQTLEQIGQEPALGTLALALRDQANLALGYQRLRERRNPEAIAALQRVRSPGPCDDAALLALGWAYLLPTGGAAATSGTLQPVAYSVPPLRPGSADAIAETRRLTPFRYQQAVAKDERALDIRRALVPWSELIGRDPLDPAVQEGMLALPYALDHFGAHAQAVEYYQRALNQLGAARETLDTAQQQVRNGELLKLLDRRDAVEDSGWPRLLVAMRDDGEVVPLRRFNDDAAFADALQRYRQLQAVNAALAADEQSLAATADDRASGLRAQSASLRQQIEALLATQRTVVSAAAQQQLDHLREQTDHYRVEAHFALARANDHLPNEPTFGGASR